MSRFARRLAERGVDPAGRRWVFVAYDQLTDAVGPLAERDPEDLGVVVVECPRKGRRRPYHRQKLALVLANLRQFALEQGARGVAVRHLVSDGPYRAALEPFAREHGPLRVMRPAERELRTDLAPLVESGLLEVAPHAGWLTTTAQFEASQGDGPPWRMDAFYRRVRHDTGLLMEDGSPAGGKYSHDADNREPWHGEPPAPEPPSFEPDEVTREVGELVEERFPDHPGELDLAALPATAADAERLWSWALERCLASFGPYEDAMSSRSWGLFHTRISPLLNLCRLLPGRVVADAAAADAPLSSREGFVRQVLGWREFVRHVHEASDGLRRLPGGAPPVAERPGDGGWSRWSGRSWPGSARDACEPDGGALPSFLGADRPLPPAYWSGDSGLECLDRVVRGVWRTGWSHHITRLMVLSNLATLLDVSPRELTDWFWVAYVDAFDWVVEPNVLGMGTFAVGELMTTKPYVSGAAYIDRMGDSCPSCAFDPRTTCPITSLYWAFLERHRDHLSGVSRMRLPLAGLRRRPAARQTADARTFEWVADALAAGRPLRPDDRPAD